VLPLSSHARTAPAIRAQALYGASSVGAIDRSDSDRRAARRVMDPNTVDPNGEPVW
jgi:hypothetical protein